mgnify:CR=1 FL=1
MSPTSSATQIPRLIAVEIGATPQQVTAAVELLDGGATVPFVARYRKEVTGGLDDTQLRKLEERLGYLRELEARRAAIAGMLVFPMLALIVIAITYLHWGANPVVAGAIKGMGAVAAGLIAGTSLKLASALKKHPLGYLPSIGIALLCFILVALIRIPLVHVLLSLGVLSIYLTYRRVKS